MPFYFSVAYKSNECVDVCKRIYLFFRDLIRKLLVHERTKRLGNMKVSAVSMPSIVYRTSVWEDTVTGLENGFEDLGFLSF